MDILIASAAFIVSLFCAGVMGFAIQRGATCTVAAVDEFVTKRRLNRLISLIEASLWVVGGLLIAQALHVLPRMPAGYAIGWATIVGALLLGVGAFINGACVFGALDVPREPLDVERIRSGDVTRRQLADARDERLGLVDHPHFAGARQARVGRELQEHELAPGRPNHGDAQVDNVHEATYPLHSHSSAAGNVWSLVGRSQ